MLEADRGERGPAGTPSGGKRTNSNVGRGHADKGREEREIAEGWMDGKDRISAAPNLQLAKLSSVLNGLEHGAGAIRDHIRQAMAATRAGTYYVDAAALSRRIISDCLLSGPRSARRARSCIAPPEICS